ncbi:diguanylate cyclase (GGDEF) domain-containing protein [Natronincola peptidivorans]|uniref:Stage 0 sporulation protein A homolog n=1 Tax=Natronincola peptidivorans TaxID=426128 RepID=A0A1I0EWT2_9FIRM|nr:diguanylate cyclase [Natronincola peptidivorans]SET50104.1 diguanylate cyclase (GGDEF) domain-containing protein [Natronincola peptidivorans]
MKKTRIMVVEDCQITAKTIKKSLQSLGYEVVDIVATGEDAVGSCFLYEPDLILMDIEIEGDMNGIETANEIRTSFDIPIIYLTALSDDDTLEKAKVTGGFAYLVKPFRKRDLYANIEMITYAHMMKKKAKEHEVKYRNIFDNMFDGFAYYKIVFDGNNKPVDYIFLEVNDIFIKSLGINRKNVINRSIKEIFSDKKYNSFLNDINVYGEAAADGVKLHIKEYYLEYAKRWFSITISSPQQGYLSTLLTDITERKNSEEKLKYLTFYDKLTGLYNRAYFEEELKRINVKRQLPLSIIIGDINGLKIANDVFGHKEGDKLLINIAQKLKESCRNEDLVARWGGDEFVILLPKTAEEATEYICNRIKKTCQQEGNGLIKTSIALGSITKNNENEDINQLLIKAESKMYKNKLIESKIAHEMIIDSLKNALMERTHETKLHIDNIKKISLQIANYIGMSQKSIQELELLAEFHDIGKISISNTTMNKTAMLTEEEWDLLKQHAVTGYRIASSSKRLIPIAEAILFHHEWWNGRGYPLGLKNEEIPIISRILAIADAYDVMIHGRAYKKPMEPNEALQEIKNCAGTQFDSKLVEIFLKVMNNIK